jgi:hypothetical protein
MTAARIASPCLALSIVLSVTTASASPIWIEVGDAGDSPATAQVTAGTGTLEAIIGTLDPPTDVDVFQIFITDPAAFSITMLGTNLSVDNDTLLYVMDAAGNLLFVDDDSGPGLLAQLNVGDLAGYAPGLYLVAYTLFLSQPIGTTPVFGWFVDPDPPQTGTVQLNFTAAQFAVTDDEPEPPVVAEPHSVLMLGIGALCVVFKRRLSAGREYTSVLTSN